jgi:imidazolonepropionase-like amidohydrolase
MKIRKIDYRKATSKAMLLSLCLIGASIAQAAELKALVGGRLIDGYGHQPLANSVILVKDNVIEKVGTVDTLTVPQGYEVISTEGMDVLPGLWENHAHLMLNGHSDYAHWDKTYLNRLSDEIMPASAVQLLLAGVTSARDLGAPLEDSMSVKNRIEDGTIPGPRLFVSGPFIQHEVPEGTEKFRWSVSSESEARRKVKTLADAGVDMIKLIDQDKLGFKIAKTVVDEAHKRGLKVIAHSHRPDEVRMGLDIGVDNFEQRHLNTPQISLKS